MLRAHPRDIPTKSVGTGVCYSFASWRTRERCSGQRIAQLVQFEGSDEGVIVADRVSAPTCSCLRVRHGERVAAACPCIEESRRMASISLRSLLPHLSHAASRSTSQVGLKAVKHRGPRYWYASLGLVLGAMD